MDENFTIVKRFDYLHMRCILEQQDALAELEDRLNKVDAQESVELRLCSRRQDDNLERRQLLRDISSSLKEYGTVFSSYFINIHA